MTAIRGVSYTGKPTEYQYFPEEYFSGSDINLYLEDTYLEDAQGLEFALREKVLPIYGYNSYTADSFARGQRIVQGSFTIAFREAGYIYRILERIGENKAAAKPIQNATANAGKPAETMPKWLENQKQTVDDMLNQMNGQEKAASNVEETPNWATLQLSSTGQSVREFQDFLLKNKTNSKYNGIYVLSSLNFAGTYKVNGSYNDMKAIKGRLNEYLIYSGAGLISKSLDTTSTKYDNATVEAVRMFQKHFSAILAVDGMLGPKTLAILNRGLVVNGTFDAPTKLATMKFQAAQGLQVDGILGPATRGKIKISYAVSGGASNPSQKDFADYEASIWGEIDNQDADVYNKPHFYGTKQQQWLQTEGFDIYINYGQLPGDYQIQGTAVTSVTYSNTIRAIRNVQLTDVQQILSPTGEPVAERYMFIAKDLN